MHASIPAAAVLGLGLVLGACQPQPSRDDAGGGDPPAAVAMPPADASDPTTEPRDARDARAQAAATAPATVPEAFVGRYAASPAACAGRGDESALGITASTLRFHEGSGEVVSAEVVGDDLLVVLDMAGEGERWQRGYRFRRDGDGALLDVDGGIRRVRCSAG